VLRIVGFVRQLTRALKEPNRNAVPRRWPTLHAAHALSASVSWTRRELEARLLTDESDNAIGERLGIDPKVVGSYHDLFFDVRGRLRASDWIALHVLRPQKDSNESVGEIGLTLRHYAYHGGPMVLDSLLDYYRNPSNGPVVSEPADLATECRRRLVEAALMCRGLSASEPGAVRKLEQICRVVDQLQMTLRHLESLGSGTNALSLSAEVRGELATDATTPVPQPDGRTDRPIVDEGQTGLFVQAA
jgi:hypothetical protein